MKTITFRLTAVQPLLLTSLQGDPNSSVSFPYIPGSVIRGALIGQYCQEHDLDLEAPDIRRWFFDGTTRYLNAYPLIDGIRTIPIPRMLAAEKTAEWDNDTLIVFDRSTTTPDMIPLRSLTGFIARDQRGNLRYTTTRMLVNIHNQRDRPRGRGIEGAGAVFRYEAIAPEQTFVAAIICDNDNDALIIEKRIPERFWIGGSRNAGYGEVRIDNIKVDVGWSEVRPYEMIDTFEDEDNKPLSDNDPTRLTITLTSDMIIRAYDGGYSTASPDVQISTLLGVSLKLDKTRTALGSTLHGGFNRTWGLPIPHTPALTAGSVLTYNCDSPPTTAALARLVAEGIGERRAEGFGRVMYNVLPSEETHTLYRWIPDQHISEVEADTDELMLDDESRGLAHVMAKRLLQQRLETRLIEQTQKHQINGTISNTQLSRLRIIARKALGSGEIGDIERFLDALPAHAREQFAHARVNTQSLDVWIRQHLTPVPVEWTGDELKVTVADVTLQPDEKMQTDFTLRLLMAMARLKVKGEERE